MAILRMAPGEAVPIAGTYALFGHYGDPMGFARWFDQGERLPLVAANGPMWFVRLDDSREVLAVA